jgi:hypothetical protein
MPSIKKLDHIDVPYRPVPDLCKIEETDQVSNVTLQGTMIKSSLPSSRMTLSPKTTTSNSRLAMIRFKILRLGLLRALISSAQIPMTPHGAGLASRC